MPIEFRLPELGENVTKAQVVNVLVKPGDRITSDQVVLEVETDKAVLEIPCPHGGIVTQVFAQPGTELSIGAPVLAIEAEPDATVKTASVPARPAPEPPPKAPSPPIPAPAPSIAPTSGVGPAQITPGTGGSAAPSVRRLAREVGVDLAKVRGSGPGGRILREDVLAASRARLEQRAIVSTPPPTTGDTSAASSDLYGPYGEVRRAAMSKVRRATAEQMARAWATIPHVTHFDETDITDLDRQRRALAPDVEAAGGSLTMTAILLKITALALRRFPQFAASIDMERQEVIYKEYVHIGVAVDTERGLIVPVLRDADRKSLVDIAIELHSLAARARSGKLALEEMRGAVFTITNLGGIGGVGFTPIINPPEVAILAVSRATVRPVMRSGVWEPRLILPFSLSYDHRIIDGADAARFCRWIAQTIETPLKLLLEQADV